MMIVEIQRMILIINDNLGLEEYISELESFVNKKFSCKHCDKFIELVCELKSHFDHGDFSGIDFYDFGCLGKRIIREESQGKESKSQS